MVIGIGIDIVDIESFTNSFDSSKKFCQRVFTKSEVEYCESKLYKYQHYAARFAAKEAFMKALGTGWDKGIQWKQIETTNDKSGKPLLILTGEALNQAEKMGCNSMFISLSHTESQAIAFVVLEKH